MLSPAALSGQPVSRSRCASMVSMAAESTRGGAMVGGGCSSHHCSSRAVCTATAASVTPGVRGHECSTSCTWQAPRSGSFALRRGRARHTDERGPSGPGNSRRPSVPAAAEFQTRRPRRHALARGGGPPHGGDRPDRSPHCAPRVPTRHPSRAQSARPSFPCGPVTADASRRPGPSASWNSVRKASLRATSSPPGTGTQHPVSMDL